MPLKGNARTARPQIAVPGIFDADSKVWIINHVEITRKRKLLLATATMVQPSLLCCLSSGLSAILVELQRMNRTPVSLQGFP